ncbi:MAG TPA: glycosyltransferase family 39 protein [Acidobacteriaceae bacterium]|nr:glycosyltransferase family 39 protein [Acidobacteriaceae bacterium]
MVEPLQLSLPEGTPSLERFGDVPLPLLFFLAFAAVSLTHLTLLRLPYFWDEGGYYVPAALDFYRTGSLIPVFTNAHPPLPNVVLGLLWHLFGFHILVTRLTACAFAAAGLVAVFALGRRLLGTPAGLVLALLTAVYPIWFAQSSLAHADIVAAAFSLAALALVLSSPEDIGGSAGNFSARQRIVWTANLFCLAALSKETAVIQPVTLAALQLWRLRKENAWSRSGAVHWLMAFLLPVPVLATWFGYHFLKTGYVFGNPEFLHYNATANFTLAHVFYALRIRWVHLFWQRNMWLPLLLAGACLLLPRRTPEASRTPLLLGLPGTVTRTIGWLVLANLVAFSVLGGALLTRYLLPVYPLLLLLCVAVWQERTAAWPWLAAITGAAFLSALWLNPSTFFAPEDNLTYRDMIVVQQDAIDFLNQHFPDATVLTAWPVSGDLSRPELGYTEHTFHVFSLENFTAPELAKAMQQPGRYDTALVFTTHFTSPAFRQYLLSNPASWRGRRYAADLDLNPTEIARLLGGEVVWQEDRNGEWAAVLRFRRSYNASLLPLQIEP